MDCKNPFISKRKGAVGMKKGLALALLAVMIPMGMATSAAALQTVKLSEMDAGYQDLDKQRDNLKFGFMDFYYGEPFEEIQKQYPLENEWGNRWFVRDMDMKGFLGFKNPGYVTFLFKDNKLAGLSMFVEGDNRNIAMNLVEEFGTPRLQGSVPGKMQHYLWRKGKIVIVYQHDENEENVLLDFCSPNDVSIGIK